MEDATDEMIIDRFLDTGEIRHVDELVKRHIAGVRAMIQAMVMNHADADELTHDVFLRAAEGLAGFKHGARFSTWLHRIAVNTAYNHLRKRRRSRVDHWAEIPDELVRTDVDPARNSIASETDGVVERALAHLTPKLRAAIALTTIHGLSIDDAARAEGCMKATMYWRVHHARKLLKTELEPYVTP